MFHHLRHFAMDGLLKGWLNSLRELDAFVAETSLKQKALLKTKELFSTPDWEAWNQQFTLGSSRKNQKVQLIGKDRQIIIWANAILPFFLAYARHTQDRHLEKLLYRLFLVLPPEAPNRYTRFMEKRLASFTPQKNGPMGR